MEQLDQLTLEQEVVAQLARHWSDLPTADDDPPARRQAALSILGRSVNSSAPLSQLLEDAARLAGSTLNADCFSLAHTAPGREILDFHFGSCQAQTGRDALRQYDLAMHDNASASGFALKSGHPVVIADLVAERRFNDDVLEQHGVACGIVCSLSNAKRHFGAIGIFYVEPRELTKEYVLFLDAVAQLLGATIARHQAEQALSEQKRFLAAAMDSTDSIIVSLNLDGRIERFNRACQTVSGFKIDEVRGRHIWNAFLLPEEVGLAHQAFDQLRRGTSPVKLETYLLTKHGERRRIAWSFNLLRGDDGNVRSFVGSGIDVTAQHETLARLKQAEDSAKQARRELFELRNVGGKVDSARGSTPLSNVDKPPQLRGDRRKQARRAYPYLQSIAPVDGDRLPELREFSEVRCHDISPCGFSFLAPSPPRHDHFVVAFGSPPSRIYLIAKVVHMNSYRHEAADMYLVGCQYTSRANYDHETA